ncbi:MAG: hypothetical protein H7263_15785 [Candidatus Sericytochromatia bacterium]|nr:hypothetical protein [Candidatus Sericytochromatia bacterium]
MKKPNYYKEALSETLNIILLLVISFSSVLLGFKFIPFILLALEVIYLIKLPANKTYQKYVNNRNGYQEALSGTAFKERRKDFSNLDESVRQKCLNLENKYNDLIKTAAKNPDILIMMDKDLHQLDYLLENYISFSETLSGYNNYLIQNNTTKQETDIKDMKQRIKRCFDSLGDNDLDITFERMKKKTLLQNNLVVLQKRLDKMKQIKSLSETLKAQIDVIEDTFYLVGDHVITFTPGESLKIDFNSIVHGVETTEKIVRNTQEEMNKLKNIASQNIKQY